MHMHWYRRQYRDYETGEWRSSMSTAARPGTRAHDELEQLVAEGAAFRGHCVVIPGEWSAADRAAGTDLRDVQTRWVRL